MSLEGEGVELDIGDHLDCNPATPAYVVSLTGTCATKSTWNGGYRDTLSASYRLVIEQ